MQPDRWQLIESIFHGALEVPEERRSAFLDESCSNDNDLRREVERLLARSQEAESFLEDPAWDVAARAANANEGLSGDFAHNGLAEAGDSVAHYRIVRKLGSGGMGVVFEAEDLRLRRNVALKFLHNRSVGDPRARQRLEREARAASSLSHVNICTIFAVEEHGAQPIIVMEFLEGESLNERIRRGPLPIADIWDIAIQTAEGLGAAHDKGIVHRDIKPANLFLTTAGQVKILDFGLAKVMPAATGEAFTHGESLTVEGVIAGTTAYMSPEQARGSELDSRTDLFSLGAVLYELATGRQPFAGPNAVVTIDAVLNARPPAPSSLNPAVPAVLDAIILRLLEKEREQRYADSAALLEELRSRRSAFRLRRKHIAVGAACLGAIAIGAVLLLVSSRAAHAKIVALAGLDAQIRPRVIAELERATTGRVVSEEEPAGGITPDSAKTLCRDADSAVLVEGSVLDFAPRRLIGLRAWDCANGEILQEVQARAENAHDVPAAIIDATRRLGAGIQPVPAAHSPADQRAGAEAFAAARKVFGTNGAKPALPMLQRAVELDPELAIAYTYIGRAYGEMDQSDLAAEFVRRSWRLRDHAAALDRLFIELGYHSVVSGNLEQVQQTLDTWIRSYPNDPIPHALLTSHVYRPAGQYERAVRESRAAIELKSDMGIIHYNLAANLSYLGRYAEAREVLATAGKQGYDIDEFLMLRHDLAFLEGKREEMNSIVEEARGRSVAENWISESEARALAWTGRLREARAISSRALEQARHAGQPERGGLWETGTAVREAFFGNAEEAKIRAADALGLSTGREVEFGVAFALATAGDSTRAEALTREMERRFPNDTAVRFDYAPTIRAVLALNRGDTEGAYRVLQLAAPLESGIHRNSVIGRFGALYPIYVRGLAHLAARRGPDAAVEFRKVLAKPGLVVSDPVGVLARVQLARALSMAGDKAAARAAYRDFFTLWKDADSDIPVLQKAREEFALLR